MPADWRVERLSAALDAVKAGRADRDVAWLLRQIVYDLELHQRPERALTPTTANPATRAPASPPKTRKDRP